MSERDKNRIGTLDEQVCFQLYLASRNLTKAYQPILEALDMTYPQYLVMLILWEHKEVSIKELGQLLGLDSGTLSPLIKRMIEKGTLSKIRDPKDERGVLVSLTKAGASLKTKAVCIPTELLKSTDLELTKLLALLKPLKELNRVLGQT